MLLTSPIAWPLSWALDRLVPEEETLPNRKNLIAIGEVQREMATEHAGHGGGSADEALTEDEVRAVTVM